MRKIAFVFVLIVALSSFISPKDSLINVYLIYVDGYPQDEVTSYIQTTNMPEHMPGNAVLGWFRIEDDDGYVTQLEFEQGFMTLDESFDNSLDDEYEILFILEKKHTN